MRVPIIRFVLALLLACSGCLTALANQPLVTMNVVNGEVRDVLTALAEIGHVNLVVDDSVTGGITIQFNNVSFETALELVAKTKGLAYHHVNNVLIVGNPEQIGRSFGNVHLFKLKYINPDALHDTALSILFGETKGEKKLESTQANDQRDSAAQKTNGNFARKDQQKASQKSTALDRLTIDYATNSLILYGTEREAEKIQNLLDKIDIPYQQIILEAEVVAINKEDVKNMGIEWSWANTPQYAEVTPPKVTALQNDAGEIVGQNVEPGKVTRESRGGVIQYGRTPEGYPYEFYYQAQINALVSKGNAKILAKPKITTIDGKEAQILIGDRIPVIEDVVTNGKTTTTNKYVLAGIKLNYTPRINTEGQITTTVHTEVSSPTLVTEMKAYRITTREAETTVRLKDGETMVIGGLIGSQDSHSHKAIPFLSKLPIIGALFKNSNNTKTDTEVIIFLTPRIVK